MAIHRVGDHASTPPVGPFRSWNFAKSKTLPSSLDFARNSTAKYWDGKSTVLSENQLVYTLNEITNGFEIIDEYDLNEIEEDFIIDLVNQYLTENDLPDEIIL